MVTTYAWHGAHLLAVPSLPPITTSQRAYVVAAYACLMAGLLAMATEHAPIQRTCMVYSYALLPIASAYTQTMTTSGWHRWKYSVRMVTVPYGCLCRLATALRTALCATVSALLARHGAEVATVPGRYVAGHPVTVPR